MNVSVGQRECVGADGWKFDARVDTDVQLSHREKEKPTSTSHGSRRLQDSIPWNVTETFF